MRRFAAPLAALASLAVAAPADAARVTYGSDLAAPATIEHATPNDSVFFNDALAAGDGVRVGVTGHVIEVRVKGRIVPSEQTLRGGAGPFDVVHFQVLRPQPDGSWLVPQYGTSTDYRMPWAGDDDQITTFRTTHQYDALCVQPGDRVDLATMGGYDPNAGYPDGTPFRVFGRVPGSSVLQYAAQGTEGVNNGTTFRPQTRHADQELLMRFVVGTGDDARPSCRGAGDSTATGDGGTTTTQPRLPAVTIPRQRARLPKSWILSIAAYCHRRADPCVGRLTARAKGRFIGAARYSIRPRDTEGVRFRFNRAGRRLFRRSGNRLRVTVTVVTKPGGEADSDRRTLVITKRTP